MNYETITNALNELDLSHLYALNTSDAITTNTITSQYPIWHEEEFDFGSCCLKSDCESDAIEDYLAMLYNLLGVNIRDAAGCLRDIDDVRTELHEKNRSYTISFEDLMNFNKN